MAFSEVKFLQAAPGALVKLESVKGVRSLQENAFLGNGGEHAEAGMPQVNEINPDSPPPQTLAKALAQSLQIPQSFRARLPVLYKRNGEIPIAWTLSLSRPAAE